MRQYLYQKHNQFFAQHAVGAEIPAQNELLNLGAKNIQKAYLGYFFECDLSNLYKIIYCSRIIIRILAPLIHFKCHSEKYLYKTAQNIDWSEFLTCEKNFSIKSNVSNSFIKNSMYANQILKDSIVDQLRKKFNNRPNINNKNPDLLLNLYINNNHARISLDVGGSSLHKRNYRKFSSSAPMKENLASTILKLSEWNKETPIYDPFCGSGTILIEAAMEYTRTPASILKNNFGFYNLPDFKLSIWNKVKEEIDSRIIDLPENLIKGSDIDNNSINGVRENIDSFNNLKSICTDIRDFRDIDDIHDHLIITNPPYGIRQKNTDEVSLLLSDFGDFLKQKCKGSIAFIYFGNKDLIKKIRLKPSLKYSLKSGGLDGMLCRYELY